MQMNKLKIYTKSYCPYCIKLKTHLGKSGVNFVEVDVDSAPELYRKLKEQTGHQTVPQIFINDVFIGGSEEYYSLEKEQA